MRSANGETRGIRPNISGTLSYTGGSKSVADADIEAKSFVMRTGTSVPDSLSVGAAVMGSVKFTLLNKNGKFNGVVWKGATFTFTLTVVNGNVTNNFPMGTYYVSSHSESGDRIDIECYDAMKIFDSYEIYEDIQNYNLFPDGNPSSIQLVVDSIIVSHHNMTYTGLANPNTGIINPHNDRMSERQLLSYIAQLNGQYVIIRPNAQGTPVVHFEWYDTTNRTYNAGTTFSHNLRTNNITITGVKVTAYSGNFSYQSGTTDNMIEIEGNPLIVASNCQFFCERIFQAVGGLTFRPGTVEIRGTPVIEAGDCLIVQTGQESNIKTLVTNLTYTFDLTIQSTADAPPYEGDLNIVRSRYVKNNAKQAISEELNDPDSELYKAINGGGSDEPGEMIILPAVEVNVFNKDNTAIPFGQYDGFEYRWYTPFSSSDSPFSSPYQMEAITRTGEYGLDIVSVTYPEQRVRIPTEIGETAYVDLLITKIKTPTISEYVTAGYSYSNYCNRDVPFYPFPSNPHKIRCRVTRANEYVIFEPYMVNKYDSNILLSDSLNGLKRPLLWFSGFGNAPMKTVDNSSQPAECYAIPSCGIPLPGMYYDLMPPETPAHELTGHKWFYLSDDGQGHQIINVIPYYDPEDPTQTYYIKYLTDD